MIYCFPESEGRTGSCDFHKWRKKDSKFTGGKSAAKSQTASQNLYQRRIGRAIPKYCRKWTVAAYFRKTHTGWLLWNHCRGTTVGVPVYRQEWNKFPVWYRSAPIRNRQYWPFWKISSGKTFKFLKKQRESAVWWKIGEKPVGNCQQTAPASLDWGWAKSYCRAWDDGTSCQGVDSH